MKIILMVFITASVLFSVVGCDENNVTSNCEDMVMVKVDIGKGFQGHNVYVDFNGENHFHADLTGSAPYAGPVATFTTHLPRGSNTCSVFGKKDVVLEDSTDFNLGDSEKYYMTIFVGISATGDTTFVFEIQDTPFGYI